MLYLVEARRTYEWGGYYEADSPEEAKEVAGLEMHFDEVLDQQMIALVVEDESE
jgi:hypothetical protein